MKKFYIPILAVYFILVSVETKAQVFNSISSNPSNFTLDDGNFWVGGVAPGNPCNNCTINIFASVTMVQNGFSSVPAYNTCLPVCNFLNDVVLNGGSINLFGSTILTINTYLELFNTTITLGNNPVSPEYIKINDQVDLNGTSSIVLANNLTTLDATDVGASTIAGPHDDFFNPGVKSPGLFAIITPDVNGYDYTWTLDQGGLGSSTNQYQPAPGVFHYILNCAPQVVGSPNSCGDGFIFGPAKTSLDPTFGVIFIQSTTLPVDLVQFLALKNGDGSVKLIWATSQEVNAGYFDIERSGDQSAWTKIGSVKAVGNSSTASNYSYIDRLPVDGTGYYKLKMVDLDGKFKYSKTVAVTVETDSRPLVIYSNPFSDMIRLKINVSRGQNLTMTVSDMLGKTYINQIYHAQSGDNLVNLPSSISSHGVYILRIYGESYDQTVKLQKQ